MKRICEECGRECVIRKKEGLKTFKTRRFCSHRCAGKVSRTTNGMSNTKMRRTYDRLNQRCTNSKEDSFKYYGARGIKCLWNNFDAFIDDMHESYLEHVKEFGEKNTSIDRIDNDGNYCKENCRWATYKEQARNTRTNRIITYKGEAKCLAEWAEEVGIGRDTIKYRLNMGWSTEKALTTLVKR